MLRVLPTGSDLSVFSTDNCTDEVECSLCSSEPCPSFHVAAIELWVLEMIGRKQRVATLVEPFFCENTPAANFSASRGTTRKKARTSTDRRMMKYKTGKYTDTVNFPK